MTDTECILGKWVKKTGGDYYFEGEIIGIIQKRSGATRVVVEDTRGLLFIFNPGQLSPLYSGTAGPPHDK
jgi:hypothetical protein